MWLAYVYFVFVHSLVRCHLLLPPFIDTQEAVTLCTVRRSIGEADVARMRR